MANTSTAAGTYRLRGIELATAYFQARANLAKPGVEDDYLAQAYNEAREKLAEYCLQRIRILVRAFVYGRCFCPKSCGPHIFADECISKASEKYALGIDTLESPEALHAWLGTTVRCAVIDEFWHIRGHGEDERTMVPIEKENVEGDVVELLEDKVARDAALAHLPASILLMIDADAWAEQLENRELLKKALKKHAEDDPESASWVGRTWEDPSLTVEDIARFRACSVRTVFRLLREDNEAVIGIGKKMIGKEVPGEPTETPAA